MGLVKIGFVCTGEYLHRTVLELPSGTGPRLNHGQGKSKGSGSGWGQTAPVTVLLDGSAHGSLS